ncbi:MAG TPA: cell division protein FtsA, partial [Candidatus Moranbacteria bacterium]|nr:cell division protein FtsA [Candidatus Moranbacteria bacterium]
MPKGNIIVGLDIGSSNVYTIIAQSIPEEETPRIIGVGAASAIGMRRGSVVDTEETTKAINESIEKAEKMSGSSVDRAVVSIGGSETICQNSKGVVAVGKADGEVTEDDINRAVSAAQTISIPLNREIIH